MKHEPWLLVVLSSLVVATGCAKRVQSPDMTFEAQQRVVLTFRGGEEIEGRLDVGRKVQLREPEVLWTARIKELTEEKIVLTDLVRIRESSNARMEIDRASDYRLRISEPAPDKLLLRSEITRVDQIRTDAGRTGRISTFVGFGAAVVALLLGERS